MLDLRRKRRPSGGMAGNGMPEYAMKVTVREVSGGGVKLSVEVPAGMRIQRWTNWDGSTAGVRTHRPKGCEPAPRHETDRWEDDGGGAGVPAGVPATPYAAVSLASGYPW
jgi:hypothetical protein